MSGLEVDGMTVLQLGPQELRVSMRKWILQVIKLVNNIVNRPIGISRNRW